MWYAVQRVALSLLLIRALGEMVFEDKPGPGAVPVEARPGHISLSEPPSPFMWLEQRKDGAAPTPSPWQKV